MVVRCIGKVADAYKLDKKTERTFKPLGSIAYDDRILNWRFAKQSVSIWTMNGRSEVPFVAGEQQLALLRNRQGESDLVYRKGMFYLFATCNVEEPPPAETAEFLGVDLGVVNIATDSDGETFSGEAVERSRQHYSRMRAGLQRVGTRSAKRKLKRSSKRERDFRKNTNHVISKRLVSKAKDTKRGIALEELGGIRARLTVRKAQRARHSGWAFFQLRAFIAYKARLVGVLVQAVDPRNTSRTCPECGCIDKRNRPEQAVFRCVSWGFSGHADTIAAVNVAARAVVMRPMVAATS